MKQYVNKYHTGHHLYRVLPDWIYHLTLQTNGNGTLTAPVTGATAHSTVPLTATPNYDSVFDNYQVTGASIQGNDLTFAEEDVTAKANFTKVGTGKYNLCVDEPNYSAGVIHHIHIDTSDAAGNGIVGLRVKWNIQPTQSITPLNVYGIRLNNGTWCSGYAWDTPNPTSQSIEPVDGFGLWWGNYRVSGQELSAADYKMPIVDARHSNIWHYLNPKLSGARPSIGGSYLYWNTATNCFGEHTFSYLFENYSDYHNENKAHVSAYLDGELQYTCWQPGQLMQVREIEGFDFGAYPTGFFSGSVCPIQVVTFNSVASANNWAKGGV